MHLEAETKPHVYKKFKIFWKNIVSTMACLNSKNGPKSRLRLLGVNLEAWISSSILLYYPKEIWKFHSAKFLNVNIHPYQIFLVTCNCWKWPKKKHYRSFIILILYMFWRWWGKKLGGWCIIHKAQDPIDWLFYQPS